MRLLVTPLWLPRAGSRTEEYEDAFYPRRPGSRHGRRMRFAVADGASESMLSGLWADLLVRTWCRARRRRVGEVFRAAFDSWQVELAAYLEHRVREERPIQWFEEPGLAKGAHATLLGLQVTTTSRTGGRWSAISLGDSCLFHVRGGELLTSFPLKSSSDFGRSPKLVPSITDRPELVLTNLDLCEGECQVGDSLLLATDAMAAWLLAGVEAGRQPWKELQSFNGHVPELFAAWVGEQRGRGALRNDDVTLLRLEVTDNAGGLEGTGRDLSTQSEGGS